jgi:hypothetical protein
MSCPLPHPHERFDDSEPIRGGDSEDFTKYSVMSSRPDPLSNDELLARYKSAIATKNVQDAIDLARKAEMRYKPGDQRQRLCSNPICEEVGSLRCSRCQQSYYCSTRCQKGAWPSHKKDCKEVPK